MRNRPGRPDRVRHALGLHGGRGEQTDPRGKRPLPEKIIVLGATSAIAQAWMRLLINRLLPGQASFFLVSRNAVHLESVANDLITRGAAAVYAETADLDDTSGHPALLERAVDSLGGLDCALIAHGFLGNQSDGEQDFATALSSLQTNFLSAASLVTWLANYFSRNCRGTIAIISSVAGDRGRKSNYIYGSAKAGLNAFLDGVRNRVDRNGVQVLTIRPGFVATPMTAHLPQGLLFAHPDAVAHDILQAMENGRDILYTPWFWRWIMVVIRAIPEWKFKRMDL